MTWCSSDSKLKAWKTDVGSRGLRVNMKKTKCWFDVFKKSGKYPVLSAAVCRKQLHRVFAVQCVGPHDNGITDPLDLWHRKTWRNILGFTTPEIRHWGYYGSLSQSFAPMVWICHVLYQICHRLLKRSPVLEGEEVLERRGPNVWRMMSVNAACLMLIQIQL